MRFLVFDLKRMFSGKALVLICLLSPIIVVLLFSAVVTPMLFSAKGLHFNLAICDEDGSEEVGQFITQLLNSQALSELVTSYPVKTTGDGITLLESGDISVLVHVPAGLFDSMRKAEEVKVEIISTRAHALEANLTSMALKSSLEAVGKSQNVIEESRNTLTAKGVGEADADEYLSKQTSSAITKYMNRRTALGAGGPISPVGEFLPVEYYISAVFAIFAALAMLPVIHFTAMDSSGAILRRGLLCGIGTSRFFTARIVTGAIFVFLVLTMLFPTSLFLRLAGTMLGGEYANNYAALAASLVLSALCFSALALSIAVWLPDESTALWTGFLLIIGMSAFCGALVPEGSLPEWAALVGRWLPLRSVMRMLSVSLFNFDENIFFQDALKTLAFSAVLLPAGFCGLVRRGKSG
ncbi:MAG: ABC transporter permease [Oscillospiraceae bacterium]|nr:ABC transporter permease [Oscillospiraceae bacterium]